MSRKPTTTTPSSSAPDPVTAYAREVIAGARMAGPHVRASCERHLRDLKEGPSRGLAWNMEEASKAIRFFESILKLNGGAYEGRAFALLPWQRFIVGSLFGWIGIDGSRRFRVAYVETGKGSGKALALDTPIPTPSGWSTMGRLSVGDDLFDETGAVCRVTAATEAMIGRPCYRVTFSDGCEIVADAGHQWLTAALRSGGKPGPQAADAPRKGGYSIRTTAEIAATLAVAASASAHPQAKWNHRIDIAGALKLPDAYLPIPPYTLGAWLGDGDSDCARLTMAYADGSIAREIEADGVTVSARARHTENVGRFLLGGVRGGRNALKLQHKLRVSGLLGNKHIPAPYLRASEAQRLALLQGLMDTDGTAAPGGKCELCFCTEALAAGALELIRTLGLKAQMHESDAVLNGRVVGRRWRIGFQAYRDFAPFRLPRKVARLAAPPTTRALSRGRMIVGCEPIPSVPVRCIKVDSASSLFLAGDSMVPTHNSPLAAGIGMKGLVADGESRAEIYSAATKKDQAMILFRDAVAMRDQSPELAKRLQKSGTGEKCWNLAYMTAGAFFRPISSDDAQSGPRPHIGLVDEVHEHKTNTVVEMLRAGTKSRRQALIFMITNSGSSKTGPCWAYHEYGIKVARGDRQDDGFFSFICGLDDEPRRVFIKHHDDASRYIVNAWDAKTTPSEKLHQQGSAHPATSKAYGKESSTQESDARITLIERSIAEAFAKVAISASAATKVPNTSANGEMHSSAGSSATGIEPEPHRKSGARVTALSRQNGGKELRTSGSALSSTKPSLPSKAALAEFVAGTATLSELIIATRPELFAGYSATNAMLESVCWETTRLLCSALSTTCDALKNARVEGQRFWVDLPADDPFQDEACWPKANPSLQDADLPGYKYIREQVTEAKGMPGKEALVRRLNFCQWTGADSPWLSHEIWSAARREYDWQDLRGRRAVAGLDLSSTTDLTGLVFLVEPLQKDEPWKLVPFAWLPEIGLQEKSDKDNVPYVQWKAEGLLSTTPGRAISKRVILQTLSGMCEFFEVTAVAYDRWRIEDLISMASDEGITLPPMQPFGQGFKDMSPAVETFERMLLNGELVHNGHKVMTMCAGNAVIEQDAAENRKLSKEKATGRIDLAVAAVMAASLTQVQKEQEKTYQLFVV